MDVISSDDSNSPTRTEKRAKETVLKNYEALYDSKIDADFEVHVGWKVIKVHKLILKSQSTYFYKMLSEDYKETQENIVSITGFSYEVIDSMLRFMYTGIYTGFSGMALELLRAADQYELNDLKQICQNKCIRIINDNNVVQMLKTACCHSAIDLKNAANNFIFTNYNIVCETDEWKTFAEENKDNPIFVLFERFSSPSTAKRPKH